MRLFVCLCVVCLFVRACQKWPKHRTRAARSPTTGKKNNEWIGAGLGLLSASKRGSEDLPLLPSSPYPPLLMRHNDMPSSAKYADWHVIRGKNIKVKRKGSETCMNLIRLLQFFSSPSVPLPCCVELFSLPRGHKVDGAEGWEWRGGRRRGLSFRPRNLSHSNG